MNFSVVRAASLWFAASCVYAQVEVVDRPVGGAVPVSDPVATSVERPASQAQVSANNVSTSNVSTNNAAELFYQFQVMQQELLELRGLVEQQANEIKKLKQQRLDDYVDLDRRIGNVTGAATAAPVASSTSSSSRSVTTRHSPSNQTSQPALASSPASEIAHYKSATKLILMNKDYDAGIDKLKEHLSLYPKGRYSGNAQYWLGEVYLAKGDLGAAKQWFETLLADYPLHAKVSDAKYKLGTTYHQLGDNDQALALLREVSSSSGSAAKLANAYLQKNF